MIKSHQRSVREIVIQRRDTTDLISDALAFGRLWCGERNAINNAIGYAKFYSRSHDAVICVCGETGNVLDPVGVI
jgi:hypothetical protein